MAEQIRLGKSKEEAGLDPFLHIIRSNDGVRNEIVKDVEENLNLYRKILYAVQNPKLRIKERKMATKQQIEDVSEEAKKVRGRNPNLWRRDPFGNLIYKPAYGNEGEYGWEMDHNRPKEKGGTDSPKNLQALQTKLNKEKGTQYPFKPKRKK